MNKYINNVKINETEKISFTLTVDSMSRLLHLMVQDLNDIIQSDLKKKNFDKEFFQYIFYKYNEFVIGLDRANQEHLTSYVDEDYLNKYFIHFVNTSINIVEGYNGEGYEKLILELNDKNLFQKRI